MGGCVNGSQFIKKQRQYEKIPTFMKSDQDSSLIQKKLSFECQLGEVEIIGLSQLEHISLQFIIQGIVEIHLPKKLPNNSNQKIKWRTYGKFTMKGTQQELSGKFLKILVYNKNQSVKPIDILQINVHYIMTGPSHHDLRIKGISNAKESARLIFNLQIVQIVSMEFDTISNEIQFNDEYPGEKFYYTIEPLLNYSNLMASIVRQASGSSFKLEEQNVYQSVASQIVEIPIISSNSYRRITEEDQRNIPHTKLKMSNLIPIQMSSIIKWNPSATTLTTFKIKMKASEISSAWLKLVLWRQNNPNKGDDQQWIKFGQMMVPMGSFTSMMEAASSERTVSSSIKDISSRRKDISFKNIKVVKDKAMEERVGLIVGELKNQNNQRLGECRLEFVLRNTPFVEQKSNCTTTEDGNTMKMFHEEIYKFNDKFLSNTFKSICDCYDQVVDKHRELMKPRKNGSRFTQYSNLKDSLVRLSNVLEQTNNNQTALWNNQNEQLLERQDALLSIAKYMVNIFDVDDNTVIEYTWKTILEVFKRNCLLLKNIGFRKEKDTKQQPINPLINRKIQIGLKYQSIINELIQKSLDGYSIVGNVGRYCQKFASYCYFTVPIFREIILCRIEEDAGYDSDDGINSISLIDNSSDPIGNAKEIEQQQSISQIIDYKKYLYEWLKDDGRSVTMNEELKDKLKNNAWIINDEGYCRFLTTTVEELKNLFKGYISSLHAYRYLPGVQKIVIWMIGKMKHTEISNYKKKGLIELTSVMLFNHQLVHVVLSIVFEKTNTNNHFDLLRVIEILESYFQHLTRTQKLKNSFPNQYFWRGVKIILEGEAVMPMARILVLIYTYFDRFNDILALMVIRDLLGILFNRLFYHWSFQIRRIFHHIIIFKLAQHPHLQCDHQLKSAIEARIIFITNNQSLYTQNKAKNLVSEMKVRHSDGLLVRMKQKLYQKRNNTNDDKILKSIIKQRKISFDNTNIMKLCDKNEPIVLVNLKNYIHLDNDKQQAVFKFTTKPSYTEEAALINISLTQSHITSHNDQSCHLSKSKRKSLYKVINEPILKQNIPYVIDATKQFRNTNEEAIKYVEKYMQIPKHDISNLIMLGIDKKDIKPSIIEY